MSEFKDFENGTKNFKTRLHERIPFSENVSFSLMGSLDSSDCHGEQCIKCNIQDVSHNIIVLLTDHHLKPGTLIKMNNNEDYSSSTEPITGIVMWSLTHNNSCKAEILLL